MAGSIKLFIGPMFASKTGSMLNEVERFRLAAKACVIVKFSADTRYDELAVRGGIVTHAGHEYTRVPTVSTTLLADIEQTLRMYDVIGVDEVQFYADNVEVLQRLACEGKIIIASGLDANWQGKPFARMGELIPLADKVHKLRAVCMQCCADASFTKRISGGDAEVEIGGADKYIAACRACMFG